MASDEDSEGSNWLFSALVRSALASFPLCLELLRQQIISVEEAAALLALGTVFIGAIALLLLARAEAEPQ